MSILGSSKAEEFATTDETRLDWRLLLIMAGILGIGLLNVYSATATGSEGNLAMRQLLWTGVGFALMGVVMIFDYRVVERLGYVIYAINVVALIITDVVGVIRYGARRWINLGFMAYQPSETAKLATILALAKYFQSRSSVRTMGLRDLLIPGAIVAVPALLTMAQPDLGTGSHIAITGGVMLLFIGIRTRLILTFALIGVVTFPLAWQYGLKPYQKQRIKVFLDPMQDPRGHGYNALQAMIAVGSGQVIGKGFQKGTQTQLEYTPEKHTDFIFTVLSEEWGFIGGGGLLLLFMLLFRRMVLIAASARDKFGSLLCVGVIGMLGSQVIINIAMVCGLLPIVGIPLPLVSYGGTSLMTVSLALGLLLNVGYRRTLF